MIARWLEAKEVCVCAGSGGVGKTSTAAAIALGMADRGAKVAVLTIDPARRLASALGLADLDNEPHRVDAPLKGELWAMMLDPKRTFDELVEQHAPDDRTRDAVLSNRIYRELSNAVAGSQEYMAMEKLHELHREGRYDLLVLDTPPTRHALDFLDAPNRLAAFIESPSLTVLTAPGSLGLKLLGRGTGVLFAGLKRATGVDLLEDLSQFFLSFGGMVDGFRERAREVNALLADERSTFVLVTSPREDALEEAIFFHRRLRESDLPFAGVVANRVRTAVPAHHADIAVEVEELFGAALGRKVVRTWDEERVLAARDRAALGRLRRRLDGAQMIEVPRLDEDVHDLDGLARLNDHLFRRARRRPPGRPSPSRRTR
ncbi:MAG TPA: ArsA-related P-loop ATPase [Thermoleophilaceae bacterium]|nr:ArsA-related P-loop ATPase [Thermoleophilaceae bacterium]